MGWDMDIQPQDSKPIIDDQELAKVLAGVTNTPNANFSYEETPIDTPATDQVITQEPVIEAPILDQTPINSSVNDVQLTTPVVNNDLEQVKKLALQELRPLVDKLELSAEEKFDIYLLLLRSTDDTTLIAPAHATAQQIEDESKRAQALLDIIKEIDFLAQPV